MISRADRRNSPQAIIAGGLALVMVVTRVHPIGAWLHLPNGSDAVFFLAGLLLDSPLFLALFMAEAAAIDAVTIMAGQSAWCVTVAYGALVLSYAALWIAGCWAARATGSPARMVAAIGGTAWVGHSIAFVISNGSFYWLSGRYPDPNFAQYLERFARYYPTFVGTAWVFSIVIAATCWAVMGRMPRKISA